MKRYAYDATANEPIEFDVEGRCFTLLHAVTPIQVSLQRGNLRSEVLDEIVPGTWVDFEHERFSKVRITSPATQSIAFMVSAVKAGWSLPPPSSERYRVLLAGLAAGATAETPVIDLGDSWGGCIIGVIYGGNASPGGVLNVRCGDTPGDMNVIAHGAGFNGTAYIAAAGTSHAFSSIRATGRYLKGSFVNGSTAQSGSAFLEIHVHRQVTA